MGIFDWILGYPAERSAPMLQWPEMAMWTVRTAFAPPPAVLRETHKTRMAKLLERRQRRTPGRDGEGSDG